MLALAGGIHMLPPAPRPHVQQNTALESFSADQHCDHVFLLKDFGYRLLEALVQLESKHVV